MNHLQYKTPGLAVKPDKSAFCWTEDASVTRNRFPSKANCDQIRLRHPCGVLMLNHVKYWQIVTVRRSISSHCARRVVRGGGIGVISPPIPKVA